MFGIILNIPETKKNSQLNVFFVYLDLYIMYNIHVHVCASTHFVHIPGLDNCNC